MKNKCENCETIQNITKKDNKLDKKAIKRNKINFSSWVKRYDELEIEFKAKQKQYKKGILKKIFEDENIKYNLFGEWCKDKNFSIFPSIYKERYWKCKFCGYKNYLESKTIFDK